MEECGKFLQLCGSHEHDAVDGTTPQGEPQQVCIRLALNSLSGLNILPHHRYLHISVLETRMLVLRDNAGRSMSQWSSMRHTAEQPYNGHLFETIVECLLHARHCSRH